MARPVYLLTGTTASGKNRVGTVVAERMGAEILSLDSMKVYRGMDVGTDKPSLEDRSRVPHHLVDVLNPNEGMNLKRFVAQAKELAAEIHSRGKDVLLVGGTALYLNGFLRGVSDGPSADLDFRARLRRESEEVGTPALHERLKVCDPKSAERIHPNDYKRIERALEVFALVGKPLSSISGQWEEPISCPYVCVVLTWPREVLYQRINRRVDRMEEAGLLQETERILASGGFGREASQCLGYREMTDVLRGICSMPEALELLKVRTRQFAKRQMTWFRSLPGAHWIEGGTDDDVMTLAARVIEAFGIPASGGPKS
jgi:tRNA dimethylallyltransferase